MSIERTLIILKPDTVARGLIGQVIARFERKGLRVAGMKLQKVSRVLAQKHYAEHKGKPFYPGLLKFITGGPIVLMVVEGLEAIAVCRKLMGATFGPNAEPGTIRGDFSGSKTFNLVHGSDSKASAKREISLYFKPSELVRYSDQGLEWVYDFRKGKPV